MRGAILLCDEVREEYHAEHGRYQDMIQRMFRAVNFDVTLDVYNCRENLFPADLSKYDFFITTGSKYSVYDADPWIENTIDFIRKLDQLNKKVIGICFGHQLIAKALGMSVTKSNKGWGLGVAKNTILHTQPWMKEITDELNIIASHQDQVDEIPANAVVIAGSDFCPYFVVQWNDHLLSIQGHPEWITAYSKVRIHDRQSILSTETYEKALASLSIKPNSKRFTKWVINFIQS